MTDTPAPVAQPLSAETLNRGLTRYLPYAPALIERFGSDAAANILAGTIASWAEAGMPDDPPGPPAIEPTHGERVIERLDQPGNRADGTRHRHRWTWAEPIGLPGQHVTWCLDCGQRKQSKKGWLQDPLRHPGEGE